VLLAAALALLPAAAWAAPGGSDTAAPPRPTGVGAVSGKEEVIYATLSASGDIRSVYAVNILHVTAAGDISDHGAYASVENLTDIGAMTLDGDRVTASASIGDFYYKGTLAKPLLPWSITVAYLLDGNALSPEALAGRSGRLEIRIDIAPDPGAPDGFWSDYLLQISIPLDTALCRHIASDGATLANAGRNKVVTHTAMPGTDTHLLLSADVVNFSMSGIELTALPFFLPIDLPDTGPMAEDLTELSDAVRTLSNGAAQLSDGVRELAAGGSALRTGAGDFLTGLTRLDGGSAALIDGSAEIAGALDSIAAALNGPAAVDFEELTQLPAALTQLSAGLGGVTEGFDALRTGFAAARDPLEAAVAAIPDEAVDEAALARLYAANPSEKALLDRLAAYYVAAAAVRETYRAVTPAFDAVGETLDTLSGHLHTLSGSLSTLAAAAQGLSAGDTSVAALTQLTAGLTALHTRYAAFHAGLAAYTGGVTELTRACSALDTGVADTANGATALAGGADELRGGLLTLRDATQEIPARIETEIASIVSGYDTSDFTPRSFISPKNTDVLSVQFVMTTEKIEPPTPAPAPPAPASKANLWTRFLDLFR
jgi:X-X-X-Leu-X-X-Gly heptad repeat protein